MVDKGGEGFVIEVAIIAMNNNAHKIDACCIEKCFDRVRNDCLSGKGLVLFGAHAAGAHAATCSDDKGNLVRGL